MGSKSYEYYIFASGFVSLCSAEVCTVKTSSAGLSITEVYAAAGGGIDIVDI